MSGPEHYRRAEELVADLEDNGQHYDPAWYAARMAQAQVHATLAVAAGINPGLQYDQQADAHDPWRAEQ